MASNTRRAALAIRALEAGVIGDSSVIAELFTDDVCGRAPGLSVSSAVELAVEVEDRASEFSDVELTTSALDVSGDRAAVEWVVNVTHAKPWEIDALRLGPTRARATLHGMMVAEFAGDRICAFRQYWDPTELVEQLVVHAAE